MLHWISPCVLVFCLSLFSPDVLVLARAVLFTATGACVPVLDCDKHCQCTSCSYCIALIDSNGFSLHAWLLLDACFYYSNTVLLQLL